jgi:hypothetical protein
MLKKLFLGAALLLSVSLFAQTQPDAKVSKMTSEKADQLNLASDLVNYGYSTRTALPLIQAVKIYQSLNVIEADDDMAPVTKQEGESSENVTKAEQPVRNEAQLLKDATTFANGDKNLLALITECKNNNRGPVGGTIVHYARVPRNSYQDWTVTLRGGESTCIVVSGDGDTDLDIYLYDQNGNFIASDTSYGDDCFIAVDVYYTSNFTLRVKNLGNVYNDYGILIY